MRQINAVVLCLAYIIGLLSTSVSWGGYGIIALGILLTYAVNKNYGKGLFNKWRDVKPKLFLAAGLVGFLATLYFQIRTPQPRVNDVSQFINNKQVVTVQGEVDSLPRLTRSQKGQFWLTAKEINQTGKVVEVTGNLYVTVPLLQSTGLYPGQAIAIKGILYKPKPATNPGGFDFKRFLQQQNTFAGMNGMQVSFNDREQPVWGLWQVSKRIVRSQVRWLGSPEGQLVSSMVLGSKAVDLPYDIRDLFVQVGLAHALAASGFQTALILGLVMSLSKGLSPRWQFGCGAVALIGFVGLTGLQPSVLRAVIMGFGALIGIATSRKIKTLGSLLVAATLLLLWNPVWIWDLGFELSFLATLGLVVTVPPLVAKLDWMPSAIATLIAVPLAATLWTLPLQLYIFGVIPPYSLVVNVLTIPLISIISIGGIFSAIAALIWSTAGSAIAWLLYYPTHILIWLVQFFSQLPGNSIAVGKIALWQLLAVYGLMSLIWFLPWLHKRWWLVGVIVVSLVLVPIWHSSTDFRVTILADKVEPIIVIQDRGKVLLVNSGNSTSARFTVLPFLQQQGINQIDWAISTNPLNDQNGWMEILARLPVKSFYSLIEDKKIKEQVRGSYKLLVAGESVVAGSTQIKIVSDRIPVWQLQVQNQKWLLVGNTKPNKQEIQALSKNTSSIQLILFAKAFDADLVEAIKPENAIAYTQNIVLRADNLKKIKTKIFLTGRDGAIQWTPNHKFESIIETAENNASLL
ncbi:ComEC/Rec2 family competence protein [Synechocystis sp. PCC 7509]|uniref:ComEC/Rec2 family competence protein n=1 Tax=Synechocystis sp. PCC 7509 TaxID=927677 RepID=UPI0002ABB857|nr:ComEC/Rec2 family competence protein [Synechocystis sp. PCC 7509]